MLKLWMLNVERRSRVRVFELASISPCSRSSDYLDPKSRAATRLNLSLAFGLHHGSCLHHGGGFALIVRRFAQSSASQLAVNATTSSMGMVDKAPFGKDRGRGVELRTQAIILISSRHHLRFTARTASHYTYLDVSSSGGLPETKPGHLFDAGPIG